MKKKQKKPVKTIYVPYMCDHCYALAAAYRDQGIPAITLPPPNKETLALGQDLCKGQECLPCFTTTGDIVHLVRQAEFDPEKAAIFMPTTSGSCRFGQYDILQKELLREQGLGHIEFITPSANNSYLGLGDNPVRMRQLIWQGAIAIDLLQRLTHEYRPYECQKGETDKVYQLCLDHICAAIEAGADKRLVEAMAWAAKQYETLAVDRRERRPLIGLVGEIYVRLNAFSNQEIIRQVEAAGGEIVFASLGEWFHFTTWDYRKYTALMDLYVDFFKATVSEVYQNYTERKLVEPVAHLLRFPHETPIGKLMENLKPYYHPDLNSEATLSMGKAIDMFKHDGACGIINVMPFSCMPGIITAGMAPRLRADLENIPWLDLIFDGQEGTNLKTRLEAFIYQAVQFQRRKKVDLL